ncbi:MAG: hypothetical protein ACYCOU_18050 [Sulfobacillus sp.]
MLYLEGTSLPIVPIIRVVTLSYCIYDAVASPIISATPGKAFFWEVLFHHAVFSYTVVWVLPVHPDAVMRAYLCELTNPFLNYG